MDPVTLLTDTFALLDAHDVDACQARLAPDFRMHLAGAPGPMTGTDTWRGGVDYLLSAFPDLAVTVDDAFEGTEDRVTCLMTLSGTHRGEFLGVGPTGRHVSWASYEVYRVRDDVVTEEWILSDLHALVSQLTHGAPSDA